MKTLTDRFHSKYERITESGCWIWFATGAQEYGGVTIDGKSISAHRVSWMLHYGPIPAGMCVLHKCDVRGCVRPDHLFIGSKAENAADMIAKGRKNAAKGESHGRAKLTTDDIMAIREDRRTQRIISGEYGVAESLISAIKNRKIWAHIA